MKKTWIVSSVILILFVIAIALLCYSPLLNAKKETETTVEIDGKEYTFWQGWHRNGNKWYEHYSLGFKDEGKQIDWAENGQKIKEVYMEKGYRHGPNKAWHLNGKVSVESNYQFCRLDGSYQSYFENEQLEKSATYSMGIPIGDYQEYRSNGKTSIEASFDKNGQPIGIWQSWDEQGKLKQALEFMDGKQESQIKPSSINSIVDEFGSPDFAYIQGHGSGMNGYNVLKVSANGNAEYLHRTSFRRLWDGKEDKYIKKGEIYIDVEWKKAVFTLTDKEQGLLCLALKKADLFNLNDQYINQNIHDGTQWKFKLRINGKVKEIYCSNWFPGKLTTLSQTLGGQIVSNHQLEILASTPLKNRINDFEWLADGDEN